MAHHAHTLDTLAFIAGKIFGSKRQVMRPETADEAIGFLSATGMAGVLDVGSLAPAEFFED